MLATLNLRIPQRKVSEEMLDQLLDELDTQQRLRHLLDILDEATILITSLGAPTAQVVLAPVKVRSDWLAGSKCHHAFG